MVNVPLTAFPAILTSFPDMLTPADVSFKASVTLPLYGAHSIVGVADYVNLAVVPIGARQMVSCPVIP